MKVLLFGGTSEGRALAGWMLEKRITCTVCVATEYGETLLPPGADARVGRLNQEEMAAVMEDCTIVVDATHPYAAAVTENIRAAAAKAGKPCLRLLRGSQLEDGDSLTVTDMAAAADLLETMPGNVLLTTGSKELNHFARFGLKERCYPRVLPMMESLERCLTLGFPPAHILCMQGPFSKELNLALLRQYEISILVTKDTGGYGGFQAKMEAAKAADCALLVVERPIKETGETLEEVKMELERLAEQ